MGIMERAEHSIIAELEDSVRSGTPDRRAATLRHVTDLFFLHNDASLSKQQIKLFDEVLCLLIAHVESRARAELGQRLASLDWAPSEVIQQLAGDDEIAVAGNVLVNSSRVKTGVLWEIANIQGQDHLLAISGRKNLPEVITDVIVDRGERKVIRKLANNASARFSDQGYSGIVARAESDDELVEILGLRFDLPLKLLRDLMRHATDAVRTRLLANAPHELQQDIRQVLDTIATGDTGEQTASAAHFSCAEQTVRRLKDLNELGDAAVVRFAETGKFDEVAASLAILNDVTTDMMARVLKGPRSDLILIPCKSAGLSWPAVEMVLRNRPVQPRISEQTLKLAFTDYGKLSAWTARHTLRFWQDHSQNKK
jgi:uncharacterized protein (DUF2336 family)